MRRKIKKKEKEEGFLVEMCQGVLLQGSGGKEAGAIDQKRREK